MKPSLLHIPVNFQLSFKYQVTFHFFPANMKIVNGKLLLTYVINKKNMIIIIIIIERVSLKCR